MIRDHFVNDVYEVNAVQWLCVCVDTELNERLITVAMNCDPGESASRPAP